MTLPLAVFSLYGALSVVALVLFAWDKHRARVKRRRVPESRLHWVELLGGFPGALLGMQLFRHKRRKASYWSITLAIAALHLLLWGVGWAAVGWAAG